MPDLIETRSNGSGICEICSKSRSFKSFAGIIFFYYNSLCISTQTNVFLDALASLKTCLSRFCHLLSDVASDCLNSALETLSKTKIETKKKTKTNQECTAHVAHELGPILGLFSETLGILHTQFNF